MTILRKGITTGACAAAAAKAAVLCWLGQHQSTVIVTAPQGHHITVPVHKCCKTANGGKAEVIKDAGDDPDITNGASIIAEVDVLAESQASTITLQAGAGVGIITKPGLSVAVGQPAINPGPQAMIKQAVYDVLPQGYSAIVTITIPDGEKLARRTLNPSLGIINGLSVIGTTGIVEPMSEEAFKTSLKPQISIAKAAGYDSIIYVPGKIGQDIAINKYNLPADAVIQTSNFIGYMLEQAVNFHIKQVLLFGHLGKISKIAAGVFHTHNRMADARLETIAAYAASLGASPAAIKLILSATTTEAAMTVIAEYDITAVYNILAERASLRAMRYVFDDLTVGTVIVSMQGTILGLDNNARLIGGHLGWNIK